MKIEDLDIAPELRLAGPEVQAVRLHADRDFDPDTAVVTKVVTTLEVVADRVPDFVTVNGVEFRPTKSIDGRA